MQVTFSAPEEHVETRCVWYLVSRVYILLEKWRKETVDPVIQYLKNSELWFFYPRLSSSPLLLLMFIINSLVRSWDKKAPQGVPATAVLKLKTGERHYLSWNSAEQFAKTVHTDANFKIHRNKKSQTTTSKWQMNGKRSSYNMTRNFPSTISHIDHIFKLYLGELGQRHLPVCSKKDSRLTLPRWNISRYLPTTTCGLTKNSKNFQPHILSDSSDAGIFTRKYYIAYLTYHVPF